MPNKRWVAIYEVIFGLIALGALAAENIARSARGINLLTDIWIYFTNQSGLIVALVLLASSYSYRTGKTWAWLDPLRGAATLYSVITGVVFAVLVHDASPVYMIDHHILHQVMPIAMVVGWILHQPSTRIDYRRTFFWLWYPWAYAIGALLGGYITGVYTYDFLDPTSSGYLPVVITIGVLTLFGMFVSWVLVWLIPRVIDWLRMYRLTRAGV